VQGRTWAPDVAPVGGRWVLYYSAQESTSGLQCIGRAIASSPTGPFTDAFDAPLVCQLDRGGSIDPSTFVDAGGQRWLLWKSEDDRLGRRSVLWSAPLGADGMGLVGDPTPLLSAGARWEGNTIEGPALFESSESLLLFYGGNRYSTAAYAIGYAVCASPAGPCTKRTAVKPWASLATTSVRGPGGPSVLRKSTGETFLFFHGWLNGVGYPNGERAMYAEPLTMANGAPSIPILRPEPNRLLRGSNTPGDADNEFTFGDPGDVQLACDTTGSGVATPVVFRRGTWYLRRTNDSGRADSAFGFGNPGDVPVCGDWNGDGIETPGVFRDGVWYLRNTNSSGYADASFGFGNPGDEPVVGRWTSDGVSVGVHRGNQFLLASVLGAPTADRVITYGDAGDRPVAGDWNGDAIDTIGVFRGGTWLLRNTNTTGNADIAIGFGDPADNPLPGAWTAHGPDTVGVAR
jgi:hypothetical protein